MSKITKTNINPANADTIRRITWYGLIINTILSIVKLIIGFVGVSQVVIADALHSFSDSITDIAIIIGVKYWSAPPDNKHPYGHQKIETIVTAFISLLLVLVAAGIAYDGIVTLKESDKNMPNSIAIYGPIISIIIKEFLYKWNIKVGNRIRSTALIANAWHHRSDVISSVLALITVGLALLVPNISFVDNIGAIIVALFILKVAWDLLSPAISELTDSKAYEITNSEILKITTSLNGVKSAHAIRTRQIGKSILVDLHVLVDGSITVTEGHNISDNVQKELIKHNPDIIDVVVHIEPAK
jgi:cation diffusion facilitator family transporter